MCSVQFFDSSGQKEQKEPGASPAAKRMRTEATTKDAKRKVRGEHLQHFFHTLRCCFDQVPASPTPVDLGDGEELQLHAAAFSSFSG